MHQAFYNVTGRTSFPFQPTYHIYSLKDLIDLLQILWIKCCLLYTSEDGQPVVGASVLVKGTTQGTITDVDGNFNLANVPSSAKMCIRDRPLPVRLQN